MLQLVAVLLLPYLTFIFFAEQFNPFAHPKSLIKRSRLRYGRRMGLAMGFGVILTLALITYSSLSMPLDIALGVAVIVLMSGIVTYRWMQDNAHR